VNVKVLATSASHFAVKRCLGPFWIRRKWLAKTQWYDEDRLRTLQLNRLRKLVRHCLATVPYYREAMNTKDSPPVAIASLEDIKSFPILSKSDILAAGDALISERYPHCALKSARTGGSTGTPLIIKRNWALIGNEHAFVRRQWDWAGISLSDRCAILMSRIVADTNRSDEKLHAYAPFMRELLLSTHHLSPDTAPRYLEALRDYRISAIVGYPSAIGFLAKMSRQLGCRVRLRAALTTSEVLTPATKEEITAAFDCPVYDFCGSAERVYYIQTCEHGTYHLIPEYGYTELIPVDSSEPDRCRVVATGFWNYAMPLIRYDTGDIVIKRHHPCPCGRKFQPIESIDGREGDVIRTPSGRQLGVTLLIQILYVLCGTSNLLESQIVQDAADHLTIHFVPGRGFSGEELDEFARRLSAYIPQELKFDFLQVNSVQKTESGKVRPVISLVGDAK